MAVDGLVFIADHGVLVDESHAGFKGLEVVLARGELSRALCELLCAGSELLLAVFKRLLALRKILFALRQLLFGLGQLLFAGCELGLTGFKLRQTVLILLEHRLTLGDHVLNIYREVGDVCGNGKPHALCKRSDLSCKPCLRTVKAGQLCDASVAELDIGVQKRHERLDLRKKRLALIISVGVLVDHLLTLGDLLTSLLKSLLSGLIILIALLEGSLALVIILIALSKRRLPFVIGLLTGCIVAQTLGIGADAFVICGLVFLE